MSSCSTTDSIITTEVVPVVLPPGSRTEDAIIGATSATSIGNYDSDDDDLPPLLLVHSDNDDSEFVLYRRRVAVLLAVERDDEWKKRNRLLRDLVLQFDGFGRQSQDTVPFMGHTNEDIDRLFIALQRNVGFR
jgi:hypothetical protein